MPDFQRVGLWDGERSHQSQGCPTSITGSRTALYLSDYQADTISSEFNNTEQDTNKQEFQPSKEATWRNHLARHAASGKSIAAFCRDEAISQANFHVWRTKLANCTNERAAAPTSASTFIDLGVVSTAIVSAAAEHSPAPTPIHAPPATSRIDIRIDLGGGVVLTTARRRCSSPRARWASSCTAFR